MAGDVVLFEGFADDFFADAVGVDVCYKYISLNVQAVISRHIIHNLITSRDKDHGQRVAKEA